jgi:hypothetical protein
MVFRDAADHLALACEAKLPRAEARRWAKARRRDFEDKIISRIDNVDGKLRREAVGLGAGKPVYFTRKQPRLAHGSPEAKGIVSKDPPVAPERASGFGLSYRTNRKSSAT